MPERYKAYYDAVAPIFDRVRLDRDREIETTLEVISRFAQPDCGRVLDIGCGTGRYAARLKYAGYEIFGIDNSMSQIEHAQQVLPLVCGNATAIPFKSKSFAACLAILVVHQLTIQERKLLFDEAHRLLITRGLLVIKTCSHEDLKNRPFNVFFPSSLPLNLKRYPDLRKLTNEITASGFKRPKAVATFSEETLSKTELLYSIRQRHNTTLTLIPGRELENGCVEMEHALADVEAVTIPHYHTLFIARK